MPGTLVVKPQYARLTHDTDTFGRMDPYCCVKIGGQSQTTNVCENGGKNPNWGASSLSFRISSEDLVNVEVWDKDSVSKNDLIGQGSVSMAAVASKAGTITQTCQLIYKGKAAGECYLQFEWYPDGDKKPAGGQQPAGYPGGYPYPQPMYYPPQYPPPYGYQQPPGPPGGYQQPPGGYQQPPGGYQQPPGGYQQPPGGYQQPPPGPPGGYQQPPGGYQQPPGPGGYQQQPAGPAGGHQQPPGGAGGYPQQQQQPGPGYQQPPGGYQQQPAPGYQQQKPAAPGYQQPGYQQPGFPQPQKEVINVQVQMQPPLGGGFGAGGFGPGGFGPGGFGGSGYGVQQPVGYPGGVAVINEWVLASHITKHDIKKHRDKVFYKYDRNRNGYLSHKELYFAICELFMMLNHPPPPEAYCYSIMYNFDKNGDGRMSHKEFKKFCKHLCKFETKHKKWH